MVDKLTKPDSNGGTLVAVVFSPGYGGGWSTWHDENAGWREVLLFDRDIALAVLAPSPCTSAIEAVAVHKLIAHDQAYHPDMVPGDDEWADHYHLHMPDRLAVAWVPAGTRFIVREYDGNEWVVVENDIPFVTA